MGVFNNISIMWQNTNNYMEYIMHVFLPVHENKACSVSLYMYVYPTTRDIANSLYEKDLSIEHFPLYKN